MSQSVEPTCRNASPSCDLDFRVRYAECDPMGYAHHAAYPVWFEMGRTELLRRSGVSYREIEEQGAFIVVIDLNVRYRRPARYDDQLRLRTTLVKAGHVKLEHAYELFRVRGEELLATATTTLACVGRDGRPRGLPEALIARSDTA